MRSLALAFAALSSVLLVSPSIAQPAAVSNNPADVPAGTYEVDPQHSALIGKLRHAGLSHFVFRFKRFDAQFRYDPAKPDAPVIEVRVDPSSIDTNVAGFDTNMATSTRHFNVPEFAEITYVSNSLRRTAPDKGVMEGQMTFLGKTKPVHFDVTFMGVRKARNSATVGLSAVATFKRSDFGFAEGSDNLADDVSISVEADFIQRLQ